MPGMRTQEKGRRMDLTRKMTIAVAIAYVTPDAVSSYVRDVAAAAARWEPRSRDRCLDESPDAWTCTSQQGHSGDHVAWSGLSDQYASWPQAEPLAVWERELLAPDNRRALDGEDAWPRPSPWLRVSRPERAHR